MQPIAEGITALEGNICFGAYLPYLFGIKSQLNRLTTQRLLYCKPLLDSVISGFYKRFDDLMDPYNIRSVPLYLAMITNPKYKLNYIAELRPTLLQKLKNMLISAAEMILEEEKVGCTERTQMEDMTPINIENNNEGIISLHCILMVKFLCKL